jgi:hypothetical protein
LGQHENLDLLPIAEFNQPKREDKAQVLNLNNLWRETVLHWNRSVS